MNMYNSHIVEHDSDDILSKEEKERMQQLLQDQYQLVGKEYLNLLNKI